MKNSTEFTDSLRDIINSALILSGVKIDKLEQITDSAISEFCNEWGGITFYIPKNNGTIIKERNKKILAEFNGVNVKELSKKYGLTEVSIYQIIKKARAIK